MTEDPNVAIPEHTILSRLGRGGMASVYLARHDRLGRLVAVKVIHDRFDADPLFRQRFEREARTAAGLTHPNIVPVHEYGFTEDGRPFLTMAFLDGGSLRERLQKRGPLNVDDALAITRQIAAALVVAHSRNIVHRDLKPDNVLFQGDSALLTDFGIAKVLDASTALTSLGANPGTVKYFSPEQAKERPIDQRSDIYTLGVVLYEMLTGHIPIVGDTVVQLMFGIAQSPPEPLPRPLRGMQPFMDVLLAKDPDDRVSSAVDVISIVQAMERNWLRFGEIDRLTDGVDLTASTARHVAAATSVDREASTLLAPNTTGVGQSSAAAMTPAARTPAAAHTPAAAGAADGTVARDDALSLTAQPLFASATNSTAPTEVMQAAHPATTRTASGPTRSNSTTQGGGANKLLFAGAGALLIAVAGIAYMLGSAGTAHDGVATTDAPVSAANALLGDMSAAPPIASTNPANVAAEAPAAAAAQPSDAPAVQPLVQAVAAPAAVSPAAARPAAPAATTPGTALREQSNQPPLLANLRPAQQDAQYARREERRSAANTRAEALRNANANGLFPDDAGRAAGAGQRPDAGAALVPQPVAAPAAQAPPALRFMLGDWEYRGTEAGESVHVMWRLTDDGRARYLVNPGKPNVFATEGTWSYDNGRLSETFANGTSATAEVRMISRNELELRIIDNGDARSRNVKRRFQRR